MNLVEAREANSCSGSENDDETSEVEFDVETRFLTQATTNHPHNQLAVDDNEKGES
jgi:hypothetical protein